MKKYIAILRGINVGGHKKFPKAEQLEMLKNMGVKYPQVYLHTGNWLFESSQNEILLEQKISESILKKYRWEVPVLVKTVDEIQQILNNCPFSEEEKQKSYFILLYQTPSKEKVTKALEFDFPNETFHISQKCVYFYSAVGYGKSKLSNNWFENKLKVTATARNYNTMTVILKNSQQN